MPSASTQIDAITELCERIGIEVREESLGGQSGGLCQVGKNRVLFVDRDADTTTQLDRCLVALAGVDEFDRVFIPPILRDRLDELKKNLPTGDQT